MNRVAASHSSDFMGTEPIPRLLMRFTLPAMASSFVNCLYNVVDRLYLGHAVGPDALAGLALTMPYMIVLAAFGVLIGQGSGALISIFLGEKKPEAANQVLGQAYAMYVLFILAIQTPALLLLDQTLSWMGATPQALPHARDYLQIILWGNIFQHVSFGGSNLIRAEGDSLAAMGVIVLGAVMNIILDPVFIFWMGMGIKGAAWATILSMAISSSWVMVHFTRGSGGVQLKWRNIRLHGPIFLRVVGIGTAPCVMMCMNSVIFLFYNRSFLKYAAGDGEATLAIAAYGIVGSVLMLLLMPSFGINMGVQPILGYNTGAKLHRRVAQALTLAAAWATGICVALAILCAIFAGPVCALFSNDDGLRAVSALALRIQMWGLGFIGIGIVTGTYYQSIGRPAVSIIIGFLRQGLVLLPVLLVLPLLWGMDAIWWAGPVSDAMAGILCLGLLLRELKRLRTLEAAEGGRAAAALR